MILLFIFGVSILQYALYFFNAKSHTKIPGFIITVLFLIGHFYVFPQLFFPDRSPAGINCGMPALGIMLAFWVFGTVAILITYTSFKLTTRVKQIK